jgi:beta-lactamase class A
MRCGAGRPKVKARRHTGRAAIGVTTIAFMAATLALAASTAAAYAGVGPQSDRVRAFDAAAGSAVLVFGDAPDRGSLAGVGVNQPIVGMARDQTGNGYWLVASDGGIFSFGDAGFYGSTGGIHLRQPIVGMAPTPSGHGYWLVASDGGIFSFGDARFQGSTGGIQLAKPVVGMAASSTGHGYWLVASDGGIFSFGGAGFFGSTGGIHLSQPIVGMAGTTSGHGYWLVASDGGVFTFGDAGFYGSAGGRPLVQSVVGMAATPSGHGYWMVEGQKQGSSPFTPALVAALNGRAGLSSATVLNLHNGQVYQYRPGLPMITASIVKVQILGTLLREAQQAGRGLTPAEQALAVPMIEQSDNSAASALYAAVGGAGAVLAFDRTIGMGSTSPSPDWGLTTTTTGDQVTLVDHLAVPNSVLNDGSRNYALQLMEHVTPSQAWGVSAGVAIGVTVALKNGWLQPFMTAWTVNSIGWINGGGRDYVIAVMTDDQPTEQDGIDTIAQIASASWGSLGG